MENLDQQKQQLNTEQVYNYTERLQNKRLVDISFKNICYSVRIGQKQRIILNKLCGFCPGGQVTAILGASGAGKTTLLNVLASRVNSGGNITYSGELMANGQIYNSGLFSSFASYIMQNDVLFETLTPKEAIQFVADLKYNDAEFNKRIVMETIKTMKLESCQDTLIGGNGIKGISGGERKRTSIGFELVTNPSAIILDEPTSGLDSFTAFQIMQQFLNQRSHELKQLALNQERTIVFTIHQPSSDIFLLFDRIMLLVQGQFIYQGRREHIVDYFRSFGFNCPSKCNPMDYFIQIMHEQNELNIINFPIYFKNYAQALAQQIEQETQQGSQQQIILKKVQTSTLFQIKKISQRAMRAFCRDKIFMINRSVTSVIMGLLYGASFWNVANNDGSFKSLSNVAGALFLICMNLLIGSIMPIILQFSVEREVFLREENSKIYTTFSYFVGKSTVELPFMLITPIIQQLILYWMIGLNTEEPQYIIIHIIIAILMNLCGNSIGLMAGCAFQDVKTATGFVPMVLLLLIIFSGFLANPKNFFVWIGWLQYLSPVKYAYEAISINEYSGRSYDVEPLKLFLFEVGLWQSIIILIGFFIFFRFLAFIFLYTMRSKLQ